LLRKAVSRVMLVFLVLSMLVMTLKIQPVRADSVTVSPGTAGETLTSYSYNCWPMFHNNPRHTGSTTSKAPTTNSTLWSFARAGLCSLVVADGMIFVGSDTCMLFALNETTGKYIWSYITYGAISGSPAVDNGMVFVGTTAGCLYGLGEATGNVIWSERLGTYEGFCYSPTVADGKIFVGGESNNVYAFNEATGAEIWSFWTWGPIYSSPAVADGRVIVGSCDTYFYALSELSGRLLWCNSTAAGAIYSSPAVVDGKVFVGSDDQNVYALDEATGAKIWSFPTTGIIRSSPAVVDGMVFVGSDDQNVYALDEATGNQIWSYKTGGRVRSSPAVADGMVFVGSDDHYLYAFDETTGALLWNYATVRESPVVADGLVFAASSDGATAYALGIYRPIYDVTLGAHCNTEGVDIAVPITIDGSMDGNNTPHTYSGLNGTHSFTVPTTDANNHPFAQWNTGQSTTTITVANGGVYIAYYGQLPYPPRNLVAYPVDAFAIGQSFSIQLYWDSPQSSPDPVQGYTIYRGISSTSKTLLATVSSTTTQYLDNVGAKGIFYYDIVALYSKGSSIPSNEAICAPMESFTGIENVVHLDSLNVGPGEWVPHPFTIQQNIKVALGEGWGWWAQNTVWIDPHEMWMGGAIQVFEIKNNQIGGSGPLPTPFAFFPQTYPLPYFRAAQFNSTVAMRMTIDGGTLKIINPCNWQSFDLNLPQSTGLISVWTSTRVDGGLVYNKSPELVIVDNPIDQNVPGSKGVHFGEGTAGSVDSYIRVDSAAESRWYESAGNQVVKYGQASTAEKSTGLHWDTSGMFAYGAGYESTDSAEEGLWCSPNYAVPMVSVPSIDWAKGLASIVFSVFCPTCITLYDQSGNLSGYDPVTGNLSDGIPQSTCFSNSSLFVLSAIGNYNLLIRGTDTGGFLLQAAFQDEDGATSIMWNTSSKITRNESLVYGVTLGNGSRCMMDIVPFKTVVGEGCPMSLNVTIMNAGDFAEDFNLTLSANATAIETDTILGLPNGTSTTRNFNWNTTGLAYGNYTISACAWPVPGETDTADNNCTCSVSVHVGVPGDVSGTIPGVYDGITNMKDIAYLVSLFNTNPSSPNWQSNADVNNDGICNMKDIAIAVYYFNQHE